MAVFFRRLCVLRIVRFAIGFCWFKIMRSPWKGLLGAFWLSLNSGSSLWPCVWSCCSLFGSGPRLSLPVDGLRTMTGKAELSKAVRPDFANGLCVLSFCDSDFALRFTGQCILFERWIGLYEASPKKPEGDLDDAFWFSAGCWACDVPAWRSGRISIS